MKSSNFKFNWPLVGNENITHFLERSIINNELANSYIFSGPEDLGKTTAALFFARSLLCRKQGKIVPCGECPACRQFGQGGEDGQDESAERETAYSDFYLVKKEKDKKNISIEQIRGFIHFLNLSSFLNSYKIGVIKEAENLSPEAANALLKTLEEPKKKVIVILITASEELLPPTIVSRSCLLSFLPVKADFIYDYLLNKQAAKRSEAKDFSRLSAGRPALAKKFLEDHDFRAEYLEKGRLFLRWLGEDLNSRLAGLDKALAKKGERRELVNQAAKLIEIWQGVLRDLLLLAYEREDLIQYVVFAEELSKIKHKHAPFYLLKLVKKLKEGEKYLAANLNPRSVLEEIAISI